MRTITLSTHAWGTLAFAGLLLSLARPAAAQSCETDSDCGAGYVCHTETYEGCSGMTCRPGSPFCPPPVCQTYESKYCVSAPCSADADCPSGMLCYAPTYQECSGGTPMTPPCDPGAGGCDSPKEIDGGTFECHDVTGDATCTPRYQLPCHVAADCGAGFACEEQRYTVCSASGMGGAPSKEDPMMLPAADVGAAGGAALDAGVADGGYSYECHEESSGSFYCRLLELPCDADADCADGLECQSNPYNYDCGYVTDGGTATGVGGTPATMGAGGSTSTDDVAVAADAGRPSCVDDGAPAKVCAPHNYYSGGMYPGGGTSGGSAGSGNSGGMATGTGGVSAPPTMGGGDSTGSGSAGMGGSADGGSNSSGHDHHPAHHHHKPGHLPRLFGCTVTGGDASSQLATWFGLIGLVAFGLRRRARRA